MIPYDATRMTLLHPASTPPLLDAGSLAGTPREAIYVECARLAYFQFEIPASHQASQWRAALALLNASDVAGFSDAASGTQAYAFVMDDQEAVFAFRGTEPDSLADIGADLDAVPEAWTACDGAPGGRVHGGFAMAFNRMAARPDVQAWLQRNAQRSLVVIGHSLGAALATLGASRWGGSRLVTAGAPRVGDAAFAATIAAQRVTRFVNCCDVITTVPPELGAFTHVGAQRYIGRDGHLADALPDAAIEADRQAARHDYARHDRWVIGNNLFRDLSDHAPVNYLRAWL